MPFSRLAAGMFAALQVAHAGGIDAVVVYRSGSEVYDQAIAGAREAVAGSPYRIEYLDLNTAKSFDIAYKQPKLIVAIGIGAWEQVRSSTAETPTMPALILRQDLKEPPRQGAVYLDVSLQAIAEVLHRLFPGKSHLGLIHRHLWPAPDRATIARLKQLGFDLRVAECSGPDKLLAAFGSLRGSDFVLTEPDSDLYNSATVKPLVLASLEQRMPIVGFSAAFVRAGALAGVCPDFHELGRQTGEMILRALEGKSPPADEDVHKLNITVNQRITRLMGIEPVDWKGIQILK